MASSSFARFSKAIGQALRTSSHGSMNSLHSRECDFQASLRNSISADISLDILQTVLSKFCQYDTTNISLLSKEICLHHLSILFQNQVAFFLGFSTLDLKLVSVLYLLFLYSLETTLSLAHVLLLYLILVFNSLH